MTKQKYIVTKHGTPHVSRPNMKTDRSTLTYRDCFDPKLTTHFVKPNGKIKPLHENNRTKHEIKDSCKYSNISEYICSCCVWCFSVTLFNYSGITSLTAALAFTWMVITPRSNPQPMWLTILSFFVLFSLLLLYKYMCINGCTFNDQYCIIKAESEWKIW